ncbi:MAG TPA: non-heme iron oxygenase ferredoxin subunit [Gemmataceae bacterium]|jgi:nitrite reductase/ring-hydroxylating ferredoxin subunit|nr:non-heme iron oxygenase ferredoxin subunit [Gemmataceae bacterium]
MAFTKVATIEELPAGTAKAVVVNGRKLALFNLGGNIYAIEDTCPHRGAPLSEGECDGTAVICPWHGARFDLSSGAVLGPPASNGVMAFKVQLVGNEVQIDLP